MNRQILMTAPIKKTINIDPHQYIKELEATIEDLKQSNQDLEHFAYVASHDLQEPLRTVEGYLTLIRRSLPEEDMPEEVKHYFEHVFEGVQRLQMLIQDLLEYSRAGRMVERKTIKVYPMLEIVKYNLRNLLAKHQARIVIVDPLPETFLGHRTGITQLFQNLLSNAIRFGKPNSENIIQIAGQEDEAYLHFQIQDQGIGIAEADQSRIFELFTRLQAREFGETGSGIGLALCKRIVESHGGKIWLESQPGKGSTFHFTLKK
ncbi:MAG: histidine kinase [Bacteroidetes bacterium]|nr:MAG: histidine kinase [Bacteroidota bacterium]